MTFFRKFLRAYDVLISGFFSDFSWGEYHLAKKLASQYSASNLKSFGSDKNIVIVGAGPSLDQVDVSKVKNSIVIFLNGAVYKSELFCESNDFIWYAQDISAINHFIDDIPENMTRVITIDRWLDISKFADKLKAQDVFLNPKIRVRRMIGDDILQPSQKYSLRPQYLGLDGKGFFINNLSSPYKISPKTVMLSAISFASTLRPKNIVLLGFDVTSNAKESVYAKGVAVPKHATPTNFTLKVIELYLKEMTKQVMPFSIFNFSPLTSEQVLKKLDQQQFNSLFEA